MPMTIKLQVVEIVGNFTSAVPVMTITGSLVGASSSDKQDILEFPSGGITVRKGVPVKVSELVSESQMTARFTIGTTLDPPTLSRTIRYGEALQSIDTDDSFGEVFRELTNLTAPTVGLPARERVLTFIGGNQSIAVHFTEETISAF
ncbi:hypothetical protein ABZ498_30665 [Streptomyces lavendulocolor]|uniref:hypothetical protein n=1 Tax=Streptomyces lavendulocolor TaxID=67316 RepID=UPI0033F0D2F3